MALGVSRDLSALTATFSFPGDAGLIPLNKIMKMSGSDAA
jgi:hypothetical protein